MEKSVELAENHAHLRILHTTDLHGAVLPFDYFTNAPTDKWGFSRTAKLIENARAECASSLLLDTGDFLQGNPLVDPIGATDDGPGMTLHPMIAAMNVMSYDGTTLGNHEFNFGIPFLNAAIQYANFPVVATNILSIDDGDGRSLAELVVNSKIISRTLCDHHGAQHLIKIGILGFVPPQTEIWDQRHLEGKIKITPVLETARQRAAALRAQGADIIIALNHSGIGDEPHRSESENVGISLAMIDEIDVILCAHQHLRFPSSDFQPSEHLDPLQGSINKKPATMPGFMGSDLGVIDLRLLPPGNGQGWKIQSHLSHLRSVFETTSEGVCRPEVEDHSKIVEITRAQHCATLSRISQPLGTTKRHVHSYFALIKNCASVQLIAESQRWRVSQLLRDTDLADLPLLSAAAPFKSGGLLGGQDYTDIPIGPLTIRNVSELYLYPNALHAIIATGGTIKSWLEKSACIFNQLDPKKPDQPLRNKRVPSYTFDVILGLTYEIDLTIPPMFDTNGTAIKGHGGRIHNLQYKGVPVTNDQKFVVATNSYRASGGGGFFDPSQIKTALKTTTSNFDVLCDFIRHHKVVDIVPDEVWRFAPMTGASALFETSEKALNHLGCIDHLRPESLGATSSDFHQFRLHL